MIEIYRMNLNETKNVNLIGHIGGPSLIKEKYQETFGKQYIVPKYEPKNERSKTTNSNPET